MKAKRIKIPAPHPKLERMWREMTPELRRQFTKLMRSTPGAVRQYAEGRRGISPAVAIRIEKATIEMNVKTGIINRTELNQTCHTCEYARRCRKGEA